MGQSCQMLCMDLEMLPLVVGEGYIVMCMLFPVAHFGAGQV